MRDMTCRAGCNIRLIVLNVASGKDQSIIAGKAIICHLGIDGAPLQEQPVKVRDESIPSMMQLNLPLTQAQTNIAF